MTTVNHNSSNNVGRRITQSNGNAHNGNRITGQKRSLNMVMQSNADSLSTLNINYQSTSPSLTTKIASNSVNNNIIRSTAFNYPSTSDNGLLPRLFKSNPNTVNTLGTIFYSNNNSVSQFPKPKIPNRPLNNAENTVHKFTPIALPSKIAAPSQENNVTQLTRQPLANNQNNGTVGEMQKSYGSGKRQRRQGYFVHSAVAPQSIAVSSNSISANNQSDRAGVANNSAKTAITHSLNNNSNAPSANTPRFFKPFAAPNKNDIQKPGIPYRPNAHTINLPKPTFKKQEVTNMQQSAVLATSTNHSSKMDIDEGINSISEIPDKDRQVVLKPQVSDHSISHREYKNTDNEILNISRESDRIKAIEEHFKRENAKLNRERELERDKYEQKLKESKKVFQFVDQQNNQEKEPQIQQFQEQQSENGTTHIASNIFDDFGKPIAIQHKSYEFSPIQSPRKSNMESTRAAELLSEEIMRDIDEPIQNKSIIVSTTKQEKAIASILIPAKKETNNRNLLDPNLLFPLIQGNKKLFVAYQSNPSLSNILPILVELLQEHTRQESLENEASNTKSLETISIILAILAHLSLAPNFCKEVEAMMENADSTLESHSNPESFLFSEHSTTHTVFNNSRIKIRCSLETYDKEIMGDYQLISYRELAHITDKIIDTKLIETKLNFIELVNLRSNGAQSRHTNNIQATKLDIVALLLDFLKLIRITDQSIPSIVQNMFQLLKVLASSDSKLIQNSFSAMMSFQYLEDLFKYCSIEFIYLLLGIFPYLLKHETIMQTILSNKYNIFVLMAEKIGAILPNVDVFQLLKLRHQIVKIFIFIISKWENGLDIILGRENKQSKQEDITKALIGSVIILLRNELAELDNQIETSADSMKIQKLRISLIQDLILLLIRFNHLVVENAKSMVHELKSIRINLCERCEGNLNNYRHKVKFVFDTEVLKFI
jgi:hypothetical protein